MWIGFKKKQLRVQVTNLGILTVKGVSLDNAEGTIRRRFNKGIKLPEGCDINEIHAKFTNGELHVIMPKQVNQTQQQETMLTLSDKTNTKVQETTDEHQKTHCKSIDDGKMGRVTSFDQPKDYTFELGSELARLQERKRVVLRLGTSLVAMEAFCSFHI